MRRTYKKPNAKKTKIVVEMAMKHNAKCSGGTRHKVPSVDDFNGNTESHVK